MEEIAKGLIGHKVVITLATKAGSFEKKGKISDVRGGFIILRGDSGMEFSIPISDKWWRVSGIRAILPEYEEIIGHA